MAATANSYIPDKGEITLTVDTAEAAATGITAGTYTFDIVVRKFNPTSEPERKSKDTYVTGGTIRTVGDSKGSWVYDLVVVDDKMLGATGELAGGHTVVEILQAYHDAQVSVSQITVTPAGGSTGMIEQTIVDAEVEKVSGIMVDADAEDPAERTIRLSFTPGNITEAAHA